MVREGLRVKMTVFIDVVIHTFMKSLLDARLQARDRCGSCLPGAYHLRVQADTRLMNKHMIANFDQLSGTK